MNFVGMTTSNWARLKPGHAAAAQAVIDTFHLRGEVEVKIDTSEPATLCIFGDDTPDVWQVDQAAIDRYKAKFLDPGDWGACTPGAPNFDWDVGGGYVGLDRLLVALAPHLAEPLVVQVIGHEGLRFPFVGFAAAVEPDAADVRVVNIADPPKTTLWLVGVAGVETEVLGPYPDDETRLKAAREFRNQDEDYTAHALNVVDGRPEIYDYSGGAMAPDGEGA